MRMEVSMTAEQLNAQIATLAQERDALRAEWAQKFALAEEKVSALFHEAGIAERVEVIRSEVSALQDRLQARVDEITKEIAEHQKALSAE
jgi:outer membrane murein-binding lipoprotein Lpp